MATKKQLDALAKAREAKKSAPAQAKKQASEEVTEPKKDAAGIVERIQHDEKIKFYLPPDPLNPQVRTWERSFNGHMICLEVGRTYDLPKFLVDFISDHLNIVRVSENKYAEYERGSGKNLGM